MTRNYKPLAVGILLLLGAIGLDLLGTDLQSLPLLILSLVCGIAGALTAIRGAVEFLASYG